MDLQCQERMIGLSKYFTQKPAPEMLQLFANILTVATRYTLHPRAPRQPRTHTLHHSLFSVMMYRKISRAVKLAAINPYEHQHLPFEDILVCVVGLSPAMQSAYCCCFWLRASFHRNSLFSRIINRGIGL